MRPIHFLILGIVFINYGCSDTGTETADNTERETFTEDIVSANLPQETVRPDSVSNEYYNYKNTTLRESFSDSLQVHFSTNSTKDFFTFYVPAGNINSTKSALRIYTHRGQIIYKRVFTTSSLINGYATYEIKNDKEMEWYVLSQAKKILANDRFINPNNLIELDGILRQASKEDFEDYDVYIESKNDNRPLFYFGLEEENITILGYLAKKGKVVDVIYCC